MKLKTLTLAATGLLMAPLAFAAPVIASTSSDDTTTMGANDSNSMASPSNDDMPGADMNQQLDTQNSIGANHSSAQTPADASNSNDDMSADTATGDDDY